MEKINLSHLSPLPCLRKEKLQLAKASFRDKSTQARRPTMPCHEVGMPAVARKKNKKKQAQARRELLRKGVRSGKRIVLPAADAQKEDLILETLVQGP